MREGAKAAARWLALLAVSPILLSFWIRSLVLGGDRALEGSSQLLSLLPGVTGQYLRRAFLACVLSHCAPTAVIEFGTLFSRCGARIDDYAYIGPRCQLGLVHLERDVLLAAGVQIPSGRHTHGTGDLATPIREQGQRRAVVTIGENAWIGSSAVVMNDVGRHSIVGAGAVVVESVPAYSIAVGVPARVIRSRRPEQPQTDGRHRSETPERQA